mmetsp:Transcript_4012/g.11690  ORF Transcript_4012/g.11690 Transcript_4012/m.11690 type:complete len:201 (-) Transcript_4012:1565-2167(-)
MRIRRRRTALECCRAGQLAPLCSACASPKQSCMPTCGKRCRSRARTTGSCCGRICLSSDGSACLWRTALTSPRGRETRETRSKTLTILGAPRAIFLPASRASSRLRSLRRSPRGAMNQPSQTRMNPWTRFVEAVRRAQRRRAWTSSSEARPCGGVSRLARGTRSSLRTRLIAALAAWSTCCATALVRPRSSPKRLYLFGR